MRASASAGESGDSEARDLRHHFARWSLPCQHCPVHKLRSAKHLQLEIGMRVKEVGRVEASEISRELLRVLAIFVSYARTHSHIR